MSALRYPPAIVAGDLLAGTAGMALCALPAVAAAPPSWLLAILLACGSLFLAFTLESVSRLRRRYRIDAQGLRVEPGARAIRWDALEALELRYYSTRRDGRGGWLQLHLRARGGRLRLDSRLDDFEGVLDQALRAASRRGLELSAATLANLRALGVATVPPPGEAR